MTRPPLRRRALGWLLPLTLAPAAAVVSVSLSVPDDDVGAAREVFPLDLGTTWVYDVLDRGEPSGTRTSQVTGRGELLVGTGVAEAVRVSRSYTDYPGTGPRSSVSWFGIEGGEIRQYASSEGGGFDELVPELPSYRLPAREGSRLSYDGLLGETPLTAETELVAIEDVEVGGRTFEGCAHWVNQIGFVLTEGEPPVEETLEEWTCPGYGVVRSTDTIESLDTEITEELTQFHGAAGSWYAEGAEPEPEPPEEAPPGSTFAFGTDRAMAVPDGTLSDELAWTDARYASPLHPPVAAGDATVYAERTGHVSLRAATGEVRWRVQLTPPVMTAPTVVGDRVVVADGARRVWSLSVETGAAGWVRELGDVVSASPTPTPDGLAVPTEDGVLTVLDPAGGDTVWETTLGGPARTAPALLDDGLVVADVSGTVQLVDTAEGGTTWARGVDAGIEQGPVVVDDDGEQLVVVSDTDGVLRAWDADGDVRWAVADRQPADLPLTSANGVVVSTSGEDRVYAHDVGTGRRLWLRTLPRTSAAPVVVGDVLVVVTQDATLLQLDLRTGRTLAERSLPLPQPDAEAIVNQSPGLVDGALVVTATVQGDLSGAVLYAFPVDGRSRPGVLLTHDLRALPAPLNEPAALAGEDLVAPADHDLVVVQPDGTTTTLSTSELLVSGPVVEDDTVYVRFDDQLHALGLDGTEAWSVPSGTTLFGTQPGVGPDSVFFGESDAGLVAVDKGTGEVRWRTPLPDAPLVAVPLGLADGDVVYGGDGLARFDGRTGAPLWRVPDAYPLAPLASAGRLVVAQTVSPDGTSGVGAYDARTGAQVWFAAQPGIPRSVGPAVADGVVVAADTGGTLTAYSATDGSVLWTRTFGLPVNGTPVVTDGVVQVVVAGTGRELVDPSYRAVALDLEDGSFLGSWEPGRTPYLATGQPVSSGVPAGPLLVPGTDGVRVVELLR